MNALYLAFSYLRYHWARSVILVLVAALIMFVPIATQTLLSTSERALVARGEATPLLLGSRGSQLDLTMAALYFLRRKAPSRWRCALSRTCGTVVLADPDPVAYGVFLKLASGLSARRWITLISVNLPWSPRAAGCTVLGEAVIGADVAAKHWVRAWGMRWSQRPRTCLILMGSIRWRCPSSGCWPAPIHAG